MYKRFNDFWVNFEDQTFIKLKMPKGKTICTSYGVLKVYKYNEFVKLPNGSIGVIFDYCEKTEKKRKTIYAYFVDFEYISIGLRNIRNSWVKFDFHFQSNNAYGLIVRKDSDFPAEMNILKIIKLKRNHEERNYSGTNFYGTN